MSDTPSAPSAAPQPATAQTAAPDDRLEKMLDESSSHCRNLLYAFILFLFYVLVTVESVTDRDLLIAENTVRLPLLDIGLPLFGFFIVAPGLVILLHLNLMMELELHARKLVEWDVSNKTDHKAEQRRALKLYPFIFNYSGLTACATQTRLPGFVAWLSVYGAPLTVLALLAMKFVPYHSYGMTAWHNAAIWLDFTVILAYWFRIRRPRTVEQKKGGGIRSRAEHVGTWNLATAGIAPTLLLALLTLKVIAIPGTNQETFICWPLNNIYHRNLDVHGQTLVASPPSEAAIAAYITTGKSEDSAWQRYAVGLDLHLRDLRFANLSECKLWKCDMRGVLMDSIDMSGAVLLGSSIAWHHAIDDTTATRADGARMDRSLLGHIDASHASLNGASLRWAELSEAILDSAQLNSAELEGARINGASLTETRLNNAHLFSTQLNGAWLNRTQLNGANLEYAQLNGTSVQYAQFAGASMKEAQFNFAQFVAPEFSGADLQSAQLNGATLALANLEGANLRMAQLNGAALVLAKLDGADVSGLLLRGSQIPNSSPRVHLRTSIDKATLTIQWDSLRSHILALDGISGDKELTLITAQHISEAALRYFEFPSPHKTFHDDPGGFTASRTALACTGSVVAEGMLRQFRADDSVYVSSTRAIIARMQRSCPDSLALIRRRNPELEKGLIEAGLLRAAR